MTLHEAVHMNVYVATAIAFVFGLIVNFILSKIFVFQEGSDKTGTVGEFVAYGVIGVMGIMWILLRVGILYMIAKVVAAALVLMWNFVARKMLLYK